jgi:membrane-associated phospholipid phosphatase
MFSEIQKTPLPGHETLDIGRSTRDIEHVILDRPQFPKGTFVKIRLVLLSFLIVCGSGSLGAQDTGATVEAPAIPPPPGGRAEPAPSIDPIIARKTRGFDWEGWKRLTPNLIDDQKTVWLFPLSVAKGRHIKPTLAIAGTTVGLVALDPYTGRYFQKNKTTDYRQFNKIFSSTNTAIGTFAVPLALYGVGLIRRDVYAQRTFLLAGEAVLTSEILTSVMKDVTRRANPALIPPGGDFSDTWFKKEQGNWVRGIGAFPSGHTISAFSVATVYAKRYPNRKWKPIVAYSLAGIVGLSRSSLETHFVSDVALGAALGYFIGRHVVKADDSRR